MPDQEFVIALPEWMHEALSREAADLRVPMGYVVRDAIRAHLEGVER